MSMEDARFVLLSCESGAVHMLTMYRVRLRSWLPYSDIVLLLQHFCG